MDIDAWKKEQKGKGGVVLGAAGQISSPLAGGEAGSLAVTGAGESVVMDRLAEGPQELAAPLRVEEQGGEDLCGQQSVIQQERNFAGAVDNQLGDQAVASTAMAETGSRMDMSEEGSEVGDVGLSSAEISAGSLSPRGQPSGKQQEEGSLVIDIFNLDPIIQQERALLWSALIAENLAEHPWMLAGDFNVTVSADEKRGGLPFLVDEGVELRTFMSMAGVSDVGFLGCPFTWCNNRGGLARIWKRLDRMFVNQTAFPSGVQFQVQHLGREPSDHAPLLMSSSTRRDNKPKPFRFLNIWTKKPGLLDVIRRSWAVPCSGRPLSRLTAKLRNVKRDLQVWSREQFGNIFDAVKRAEGEVAAAEDAFGNEPCQSHWLALQEARARLRNSLVREEGYWRQKARVKWLKDGDKNSKYFHSIVAERRAKSIIHRIKNDQGEWVSDGGQVSAMGVEFFKFLLSEEPASGSWRILDVIPKVVSDVQVADLERFPSHEEIREVVFNMDGESAGGPDGFTGTFFTFAWEVVGKDLCDAVFSFFCGHELPRSVSSTWIVLIPKVTSPQDFSQFRPISLCNFVNKVISKLLANRLSKVLPGIISPQQSGFVQGRQISENFLLAQELLSDIRKSNRGGNVVLKLDMAKAYDRVSWPFLLQVLRRFGFGERWIDMIWRLISNVWFSVMVNGAPQGFFQSSRGLRQGDPISPALFVIGAEVLSRLLNSLLSSPLFSPFSVPHGCPKVTHLAYTDDVVIFSSGLKRSVRLVMKALGDYSSVSGQQVNHQKSCFLSHSRFPRARKRMLGELTGFPLREFPVKYLGCPLYVGRRKKGYFSEICDSILARVLSWKGRLLSHGGRLVLIRSVLSSMPLHILAASTPSKAIFGLLEKTFANFLWGASEGGLRFHWIKWEQLCQPYDRGGAGLRSLRDVFDAFSMKLWWQFRLRKSLWAEFLHCKYCPNFHPCSADVSPGSSWTWKRLISIQGVAEQQIRWVLSNGSASFWHDDWLGQGPLCRQVDSFQEYAVSDFVEHGRWNVQRLCSVLPSWWVGQILRVEPPAETHSDRMVWSPSTSGDFSLSSAYQSARGVGNRSCLYSSLWGQELPSNVSFFMLRLLGARLPVMDRLQKLGVVGPSRCFCCSFPCQESLDHIFCTGEVPRQIWESFEVVVGGFGVSSTIRHKVIGWWLKPTRNPFLQFLFRVLPSLICWHLWKMRNKVVFEGQRLPVAIVSDRIFCDLRDLFQIRFKNTVSSCRGWPSFFESVAGLARHYHVQFVRWRCPKQSVVKLNSDGCSRGNPGKSGGGGIIRNYEGRFLLGFSCFFGELTSLQAELEPLLHGIRLAVDRGYSALHIESDSLVLVQIIRGTVRCPWQLQRGLQEVLNAKGLVREISHCFREANRPAYRLANVGVDAGFNSTYVSFSKLPCLVRGDVNLDRVGVPNIRRSRASLAC
ncbi:uncharacterized protein LOC113772083 [Coffea eugenioides]|uniref:uncharacterized protein LOC113772083 n=1 Tax=Coffea eugenioides TaxID=49369 RepID=UPI000F60EB63|nr:uncharacterized protein LOC113772083 [Coffea eugenioides]